MQTTASLDTWRSGPTILPQDALPMRRLGSVLRGRRPSVAARDGALEWARWNHALRKHMALWTDMEIQGAQPASNTRRANGTYQYIPPSHGQYRTHPVYPCPGRSPKYTPPSSSFITYHVRQRTLGRGLVRTRRRTTITRRTSDNNRGAHPLQKRRAPHGVFLSLPRPLQYSGDLSQCTFFCSYLRTV